MAEDRFRVRPGQEVPARRPRPRLHRPLRVEGRRQAPSREGAGAAPRAAGEALRPGPVGAAADLPGHGRGGQGQRDQARDVRRQPAGLPGVLVQGALVGGAGPRLPLAHRRAACPSAAASASSTARTTRRCWSCACTRRSSSQQKLPPALVTDRIWKERYEDINAFERYLVAQRHRDPQVLPERLQGGAAQALPGAPRRAGEELEVRGRRTSRSASTGTST